MEKKDRRSDRRQDNTKMKEINLVIDIDDLNPTPKWGIEKDKGEFSFLNKLWDEFPNLKVTLFIPANFENRADLRLHDSWVKWLKSKSNIEIACHGLCHYNQVNKRDNREFFNCTPWEIAFKLNEARKIFNEMGIDVKGIKAGGWDIIPEFYEIAPYFFEYMADHFIGSEPKKIADNTDFCRVPYTYSIENIGPKYHKNILLHGHISQERGNKNGLNYPIYHNIKNYLKELESKFKVNYMTMYELVEKYKNGK